MTNARLKIRRGWRRWAIWTPLAISVAHGPGLSGASAQAEAVRLSRGSPSLSPGIALTIPQRRELLVHSPRLRGFDPDDPRAVHPSSFRETVSASATASASALDDGLGPNLEPDPHPGLDFDALSSFDANFPLKPDIRLESNLGAGPDGSSAPKSGDLGSAVLNDSALPIESRDGPISLLTGTIPVSSVSAISSSETRTAPELLFAANPESASLFRTQAIAALAAAAGTGANPNPAPSRDPDEISLTTPEPSTALIALIGSATIWLMNRVRAVRGGGRAVG